MPWNGHRFQSIPADTVTPYIAVGGTVFGPHDGIVRRSFVLAFARGSDTDVKEANQQLAKTLADRLNSEPTIVQVNPPMELVESIVRKHASHLNAECNASFQFNKLMFNWIAGNGVIF